MIFFFLNIFFASFFFYIQFITLGKHIVQAEEDKTTTNEKDFRLSAFEPTDAASATSIVLTPKTTQDLKKLIYSRGAQDSTQKSAQEELLSISQKAEKVSEKAEGEIIEETGEKRSSETNQNLKISLVADHVFQSLMGELGTGIHFLPLSNL